MLASDVGYQPGARRLSNGWVETSHDTLHVLATIAVLFWHFGTPASENSSFTHLVVCA